jgi:phage portal protein BeeE
MTVVMSPAGELNALPSATPQSGPGSDAHMISISSGARNVELAEKDGVRQVVSLEQIYRSQPMISGLVNKLYRQISTLPIKALSLNSQNEPEAVPRDHGLPTLLRSPAPRKGAVDLQEWISRGLFIHGNSLLAKWRGDGKDRPPTGLLPLRWPYVSAYAHLGGPVEWWGTTQVGDWKWLPVEESLHFAWGSDLGDIGVSPLEQLGVMLELDDASQRFQIASLKNGSRPSGAISLPKGRSSTRRSALRCAPRSAGCMRASTTRFASRF